ncbi:serine/threonine protein kinase [Penicillium odoratum]|uniref:serine/threonine protein kinase n=1 Tax=Penicillium odoratum TaxID=1167516 RepID=UPI002548C68F|nr:serine/threonine protein kinase [Penicillium odoratum]KAJ5776963.1 serine/threonine protein kinase [Penicillium odoratum]
MTFNSNLLITLALISVFHESIRTAQSSGSESSAGGLAETNLDSYSSCSRLPLNRSWNHSYREKTSCLSILLDFEETENRNSGPYKLVENRMIYSSRKLGITKVHGRPILADFGEARLSSRTGTQWEDVQPLIYRAPEVLLRIPWNHKLDIWNFGVLAWDLVEQRHLFYARDPEKKSSDTHHLAEMIAILGPPPKGVLQKSQYGDGFFLTLTRGAIEIPSISLENWRIIYKVHSKTSFSALFAKCFNGDLKIAPPQRSYFQICV